MFLRVHPDTVPFPQEQKGLSVASVDGAGSLGYNPRRPGLLRMCVAFLADRPDAEALLKALAPLAPEEEKYFANVRAYLPLRPLSPLRA